MPTSVKQNYAIWTEEEEVFALQQMNLEKYIVIFDQSA